MTDYVTMFSLSTHSHTRPCVPQPAIQHEGFKKTGTQTTFRNGPKIAPDKNCVGNFSNLTHIPASYLKIQLLLIPQMYAKMFAWK